MSMRRDIGVTVLTLLAIVVATDTPTFAQQRRGTAGAAHLRVTPTAHLAALGSVGTAGLRGLSGIEMVFSNPAGLTGDHGTGMLFSRMEYLLDISVNTVAVATQVGNNRLGMYLTSWELGDIPRQTELNPEISELTFKAQINTIAAVYARSFTDRISAGFVVKLISEDIDDMGASAVAFDGGMAYDVTGTGFRFGFSVRNIGTKLEYTGTGLARNIDTSGQGQGFLFGATTLYFASEPVDLPALLEAGISYQRPIGSSMDLSVATNFRSNSFDQDQYAAGLQIGFLDALYLRGGLELVGDTDLTLFQPESFGTGLVLDVSGVDLKFDYAYRPTDFFSDVQFFTLVVRI